MTKLKSILPGFLLAIGIAFVAEFLEGLLPIHLIGSSVIALFIGMIIHQFAKPNEITSKGITYTSKSVLKFAIILLGASLNISTILTVGQLSLTVMVFTLLTCFGGGYIIGKLLGLNWKLSNLISAGTGICGGSAIAAIAPVIEADDKDVAYAISATFLFDMLMIVLFPVMGRALGLSDMAYGLWAGTAVNDTSSVVAAGYAFSEGAGDFATMVKLTRTLSIIPTVIVFALISLNLKKKEALENGNSASLKETVSFSKLFPWFIVFFLVMAGLNSLGLFSIEFSSTLKELSKFLMVAALGAIGLKTDFFEMKQSGIQPMILGFIISILVIVVAIAVEYMVLSPEEMFAVIQ